MPPNSADTCPPDLLANLLASLRQSDATAMARLDGLLAAYPGDAQLHFLKGSLLAGAEQYPAALEAMARALAIKPDYPLARFQLGLLQLTSGMPVQAEATWAALDGLPDDAPLKLFASGLKHLIHDEFDATVELLRRGIALNTEIPVLNRDMELVLSRIGEREPTKAEDLISPTHLLLRHYSDGRPH